MVDEAQRQRHIPQSSNALDNYYGWNSSMGRDVRKDPSLPPQFQYRDQGRTVVSDTEPAFTDMGRNRNVPFPADGSALPHELQHHGVPRQHPNPRMRGMGRRKWAGRPPGPPSNIGYDRMGGGLGGLQAAVDPSDWRTIIKILEAGGNPGTETQVAEMGGYGYNPGPKSYDDIYEGLDIIDMEVLPGEGYGPSDEYDYDRKRGYPGYIYDSPPSYAARGGLMSLRR